MTCATIQVSKIVYEMSTNNLIMVKEKKWSWCCIYKDEWHI